MSWNWEKPDWPNFSYDSKVLEPAEVTGANFRAQCLALGRCGADKFGEGRDLGAWDAEASP